MGHQPDRRRPRPRSATAPLLWGTGEPGNELELLQRMRWRVALGEEDGNSSATDSGGSTPNEHATSGRRLRSREGRRERRQSQSGPSEGYVALTRSLSLNGAGAYTKPLYLFHDPSPSSSSDDELSSYLSSPTYDFSTPATPLSLWSGLSSRRPSYSELAAVQQATQVSKGENRARASLPPRSSSSFATTAAPVSNALATIACVVTIHSLWSRHPILAASPAHMMSSKHPVLETASALLSTFLVHHSAAGVALAAANLYAFSRVEVDLRTSSRVSPTRLLVLVPLLVAGTLCARAGLAWLFGRALGWAHPAWLSTTAIHSVHTGLAPLLTALVAASSMLTPIDLPVYATLAANAAVRGTHGGMDQWWALSGAICGIVGGVVVGARRPVRGSATTADGVAKRLVHAAVVFVIALPLLAAIARSPARKHHTPDLSNQFAALHSDRDFVMTVLVMSAPRPSDPDFLIDTVHSWLGAFPEPVELPVAGNATRALQHRLRLVVYTHFTEHVAFDRARRHFTGSSSLSRKASHYVEWVKDGRGHYNLLDQRLHVARGLQYATAPGRGSSAHIVLAEDDFPLCGNEVDGSLQATWRSLQHIMVQAELAMPDPVTGPARDSGVPGYCGVFFGTGGSGLAIRTPLAARLPAILLGSDDPSGDGRLARMQRGELPLRQEGEGADTPDLVIQDCLRGRISGCEMCAPGAAVPGLARSLPPSSARLPLVVPGDRYGKSGLISTERLMQTHLGYNASTLPGRKYGKEEWACGWRHPFNGEPDVLTIVQQ